MFKCVGIGARVRRNQRSSRIGIGARVPPDSVFKWLRNTQQPRSKTREQVADYIENYYNLVRLHSHLDYVSPIEFETNAPS